MTHEYIAGTLQGNGSFWTGNGQAGWGAAWYAWKHSRSAARFGLGLDWRCRMGKGRAAGWAWGEGLGKDDRGPGQPHRRSWMRLQPIIRGRT